MKRYFYFDSMSFGDIRNLAKDMLNTATITGKVVVTRFLGVDLKVSPEDSEESVVDAFEEKYQPMIRMM